MDTNDNKRLSLKEYFQSSNGLSQKALRSAFYRQDTEVDLQLSIEEYLVSLKDLPQTNRSRFVDRDTNEDGILSRKEYIEFEKAYKNRTSDMVAYKKRLTNIDENLKIVDQNNDGMLSFNEFLKMQKNPAARIRHANLQQGHPEEVPGRFIKLLWVGLTLLFAR
ncbi:MAG: EF-hand domain-containing protein [Planctomycetaceae bacterium]|nr:EF-hand domain-containing protein [Planctomycetaceae bacterium]